MTLLRRWAGFIVVTLDTHVLMINFHPILFKFCANMYVKNMFIFTTSTESVFSIKRQIWQHFSPNFLNSPRIVSNFPGKQGSTLVWESKTV